MWPDPRLSPGWTIASVACGVRAQFIDKRYQHHHLRLLLEMLKALSVPGRHLQQVMVGDNVEALHRFSWPPAPQTEDPLFTGKLAIPLAGGLRAGFLWWMLCEGDRHPT